MPKLYTKQGDRGTSSIIGQRNIAKNSLIFEVLGEIDELNARIGLLCCYVEEGSEVYDNLRHIQSRLIDIGSILSIVKKGSNIPVLDSADIKILERQIDDYEAKNSKLTTFILPGITKGDSHCHLCRTATRKVERKLCLLYSSEFYTDEAFINRDILIYFNRLSDMFFALSRNLSDCSDIVASEYA